MERFHKNPKATNGLDNIVTLELKTYTGKRVYFIKLIT